jgi:hypothetical protein
MERSIPLSQSQIARVDSEDYESLSKWKWCAWFNKCTSSFYAVRTELCCVDGKRQRRMIYMQRALLGLGHGDPLQADHRDHDTLHNTRANLRVASRSQNQHNTRRRKDCRSDFKGVHLDAQRGMWVARITVNGKQRHIGSFKEPKTAALAYDAAARTHYAEFANLNFPDPAIESPMQ